MLLFGTPGVATRPARPVRRGRLLAIRKGIAQNQATFLSILGYLNFGWGFYLLGFRRRTIMCMALIFIQVSLWAVMYS